MKRIASKKSAAHRSAAVGATRMLLSSLFGACVGVAALFALFAALSLVCAALDDPTRLILPATLASLYLSSFASGFCAAKKNGERALLCSAIGGVLYFAVVWLTFALFSLLSPDAEALANATVLRLLLLPCAILGGLCCLFLTQSTQNRPHRYKSHR